MRTKKSLVIVVALVALVACSSDGEQTDMKNVSTISPPTTTVGASAQFDSISSYAKSYIRGVTKAVEENLNSKGRSLFDNGMTPASIVNCTADRLHASLQELPPAINLMNPKVFQEEFPIRTLLSWIETCSGVSL